MNIKDHCYSKSVIFRALYFKLRFTLSYRDVEEIMKIRGVIVDHDTIQHWVYKFIPFIESKIKKRKFKVGASWRLDETYIEVKDIRCYLYRAVDKLGNTVDFLLTRKRYRMSARFF
ncbi:DDE-type integrase/transposase/recombinase [Flavobacterium sp. SLB02]|uniref:DDE-type integrase/transposase/recombinase n=1 Tax=Flavobacterium sp. SLB02 TaxID=2665645 RepID=UPI0012AAB590|nr:DDE-type integrase/transposase/recombinase [Flavobacterium sp. SLB02]QGK73527.1 DDE-type integrase/transposase/recombinase [Flavobacterium sp. SLB02]